MAIIDKYTTYLTFKSAQFINKFINKTNSSEHVDYRLFINILPRLSISSVPYQ